MAARRLLIVMLILLGASTLAAALVPQSSLRDDEGTESTESTTASAPAPAAGPEAAAAPVSGQAVQARIFVGGTTGDGKPKVPVVPLPLGDQLALTVCSRTTTDLIEIPRIGRVEPIQPGVPVYFNLLPTEEGSYALRFVDADSIAARIEVEPPRKPEAPAGPAKPQPTGCPAPAPR